MAAPVSTKNFIFPRPIVLTGTSQHPVLDICVMRSLRFSNWAEPGAEGVKRGSAPFSFPRAGADD